MATVEGATALPLPAATARRRVRPATAAQYGVLVVLLVLSLYPIFLMVSMSLRPAPLIYVALFALPDPPILDNYRTALLDLIPALLRTLAVTLSSILCVLALAAPAAYAYARMRFVGRDALFQSVLAMLMVPGVVLLVPRFIEADQLGLRGSLLGLVVFYAAGGQPFAIFLLTTFFKSQSEEVFEAARVDGAGELRALISIALPLAMPILVTITVIDFLRIYDDFVWPSLMLPKTAQTLILALERYNPPIEEFISRPDLGAQTAGFVFATIPQLALFAFGMKYFIQGLTSGSVKA